MFQEGGIANGIRYIDGVYQVTKEECERCVLDALKVGYRAIDTAQSYFNERGVGEGVRTCGIPREDLFVVSKVAAEHKTYEQAMAGIDETLKKMGLYYQDFCRVFCILNFQLKIHI